MQHQPDARAVQRSTAYVDYLSVTVDMTGPLTRHPVAGWYVEVAWLPIVGPTALLLARRLVAADRDATDRDATLVRVDELAPSLGVGVPRLWTALGRLERRGLVTVAIDEVNRVAVVKIKGVWPEAPAPRSATP